MTKTTKISIFIIICLAIFYVVWLFLVPVKNVYSMSADFPDLIKQINKNINNNDFVAVNKNITELNARIKTIDKNIQFFGFLKIVPGLNKKYDQIQKSLADLDIISSNVSAIIESSEEIGKMDKNSILISFLNNPERFQKINEAFKDLSENVSLLNSTFKIENNKLVANIKLISKVLEITEPINKNLLEIIGHDEEKRYLLLFQNNTELRPTGGFIGTYGVLTVSDGKIKNLFIDDIYHLDSQSIGKLKNQVPAPIKQYLKTEEWYMRDCNFEPDFPTAMKDCLNLYELEKNNLDQKNADNKEIFNNNQGSIDGVIALNPDVVGDLLHIVGAQEVSGMLFEGNNFTDDLQKAVELYYKERGVSQWDRKDIIKYLASNILSDLKKMSINDYQKIIDLIIKKLETKDILLFSKNQEIQNNFVKAGWAGEIKQVDSDYIMVVDSNLASYKSDQFIDRTINYDLLKNDNNELVATVKITYKHNGNFSWNSTRYRTYTRIFAPKGSQLIEVVGSMKDEKSDETGTVDKSDVYGKVSYGSFIAIEPGSSKTLIFKYKLPDYIKNQIDKKQYNLFIQKQPGVKNLQYIVSANFDENFSNLNTNLEKIINSNLTSFSGKQELTKDSLIEIKW